MKDGRCPKCNSRTVYKKEKGIEYGEHVTFVRISSEWLTWPTSIYFYICTTCGYFESYVEDRARLEAVAKDWKKVG